MTDEKLMKVLECCANNDCSNCPTQVKQCRQHAMLNALDLIKKRDEEIEEQDQAIINALHHMKVVRAEAIKEFAERLLYEYDVWTENDATEYQYVCGLVNKIIKEMTEEQR